MTAARQQYHWTPFRMTMGEVAFAAFRRGETWLRAHLKDYPNFPKPDVDGLFLTEDVLEWVRVRHGHRTKLGADSGMSILEDAARGA